MPEEIIQPKKSWFKSRTLWVNFLAAVALFAQSQFTFVFSPELQGMIIMLLNILIRFDTTTKITG